MMKEEDIIELYIKRSGCSRYYAESKGHGYRVFRRTLISILENFHDPIIKDLENIITQCERYLEKEQGEHLKLIRGVFNKLKARS